MFIVRDNREKLEKLSTLLIRVNLKQTLDFNVAKWYDFLAPKLPRAADTTCMSVYTLVELEYL